MPVWCQARRLSLVLASASLLFCVSHLFGQQQTQTGTIVGQVRLAKGGIPPDRVMVKLETRGAILSTAYTDNEGRFVFMDLWPNLYHISVNDENYYPAQVAVKVQSQLLSATFFAHILLVPRQEEKPQDTATTPSGGNPYMVDMAEYTHRFPKKVRKEYEEGLKSEAEAKHDEAKEHYRKALELAPEFYPARNNLGSLYMNQGNYRAAQEEFEEVVRQNQSDAAAYLNLGNLFLLEKRHQEALKSIEEGLRRQPFYGLGHFLLGTVYGRLGRFQDAETSLRKAVEYDPTLSKCHLELVNLYLHQRRTPEAIAELRYFVKSYPLDPLAAHAKQVLGRLEGTPAPQAH